MALSGLCPDDHWPQTGLPEQTFLSCGSGGCESKTKTPADSVSGEDSLPVYSWPSPRSVLKQQRGETGRGASSLASSVMRVLFPSWGPTPQTSSNLISSQRPHLQNPPSWGLGFQSMNLAGGQER